MPAPGEHPAFSVIVLTKDEEANLPDCVGRLLAQTWQDFEIVVVDSASSDGTVPLLRQYQEKLGSDRLRVDASPTNLSFGDARNRGIAASRGARIAFVSADAYPDPRWLEELHASLQEADIVYGKQLHAPGHADATTVSRGLRYHHFERAGYPPDAYASNVNAGFRREVFDRLTYDTAVSASEDVLLTRRARELGLRIAYNPRAIVHHKDVASFRGELRKHAREGFAGGAEAARLGLNTGILAWGGALAALALLAIPFPLMGLPLLLAALYAPTLRRALAARRPYPAAALAAGVAVSPLFDLVFLANYLKALVMPHGKVHNTAPHP